MTLRARRLRPAGHAIAAALALLIVTGAAARAETVVRVAFVGEAPAAAHGTGLGIAEADRQARYFGIRLVLSDDASHCLAGSEADACDVSFVIAATGPERIPFLLGRDRVVWNVARGSTAPRSASHPRLFHTALDERTAAAAIAAHVAARPGAPAPTATAWHPSLMRFAARDLNRRFREATGTAMDSDAWAGWAAARTLGEAVLRSGSVQPASVARYLREELRWDGQKGVPLRFGPDGRLHQPFYLVLHDGTVEEVPLGTQRGETR